MSDDYAAQLSVKFGPNDSCMLNLRGNSVGDLDRLIREAEDTVSVSSVGLVETLRAFSTVQQSFPETRPVQGQQQAPQAQPQQNAAYTCQHGARQHRSGADWEGWFCPQPKNAPDRCKPFYPGK